MSVACLLLAAGRGERLGASVPKAFVEIAGHAPIRHATEAVLASGVARHLVLVVPDGYEGQADLAVRALLPAGGDVTLRVVAGGPTRQESVDNALAVVPVDVDIVLVHDVARFLTPARIFVDVVAAVVEGNDAVIPVLPVVDTLKEVDADDLVVATPPRSALRVVQTPQGFVREVIEAAHAEAKAAGQVGVTDDAGLVERLGLPVRTIPGDEAAFKITRPLDLIRAEALIASGEVSS